MKITGEGGGIHRRRGGDLSDNKDLDRIYRINKISRASRNSEICPHPDALSALRAPFLRVPGILGIRFASRLDASSTSYASLEKITHFRLVQTFLY
jgi:hypothetical protein